jgi:hypothetical protein
MRLLSVDDPGYHQDEFHDRDLSGLMRLYQVGVERLPDYWLLVSPLLNLACIRSENRYQLGDVVQRIADGLMQLWIVAGPTEIETALVTEIIVYPEFKAARISLLGGRYRENWTGFEPELAAWAKANGCAVLQVIGRPGWERVLPEWRKVSVTLERNLA